MQNFIDVARDILFLLNDSVSSYFFHAVATAFFNNWFARFALFHALLLHSAKKGKSGEAMKSSCNKAFFFTVDFFLMMMKHFYLTQKYTF